MSTVVYLHGFNSGPGEKADFLRNNLSEDFKVLAPQLSNRPKQVLYDQVIPLIEQQSNEDIHIIGTSLGGFYAAYLATVGLRSLDNIQYYLINPSLKPTDILRDQVGTVFENYKTGVQFQLDQNYILELKSIEEELTASFEKAIQSIPFLSSLNFYIGLQDTVVEPGYLIDLLGNSRNPVKLSVSNQDHRHSDISQVVTDIKKNQYLFG